MDAEAIISYIHKEYPNVSVSGLAKEFKYSETYFCKKFKKTFGLPPQDFITAIKLQNSLEDILINDHLIIKSMLDNGYLSEGSFNNKFKHAMILPPQKLKSNFATIYEQYFRIENSISENLPDKSLVPAFNVNVICDIEFKGLVFIGLFKKPIPNTSPIIGKVIFNFNKKDRVSFSNVQPGTYYCLACVIHKTKNPMKLFILKDNLRGRVIEPINVPTYTDYTLILRNPEITDPPITMNLPLLLINMVKANKDEYRTDLDKK